MNNSKSTKRALVSSIVSMLLCRSMLIGSTFAWFTDNATTEVNKIESGNVDVELEYWNATSVTGHYWNYADYRYGGFAKYYITYGHASHDCMLANDNYLAHSELCVDTLNE